MAKSSAENANTNAQNKGRRIERQQKAMAEDRALAEKTARFGGCRV